MRIEIKVIAGAKRNIIKEENGRWRVYLQAPAVDGKANQALIEVLADHFRVRKNQVNIIKGLKSPLKTISIKGI